MGDKKARISTIIAGIWGDLMICVVATFIWWGTATGMWVHDFAYKVMMVTGIGVTILNLNPLIKLDGYYLLAELISETGLKESQPFTSQAGFAGIFSACRLKWHMFPATGASCTSFIRCSPAFIAICSSAMVVIFVYHIS